MYLCSSGNGLMHGTDGEWAGVVLLADADGAAGQHIIADALRLSRSLSHTSSLRLATGWLCALASDQLHTTHPGPAGPSRVPQWAVTLLRLSQSQ
jgi:hypothetical protein